MLNDTLRKAMLYNLNRPISEPTLQSENFRSPIAHPCRAAAEAKA
jgi:hypothetical protein